MDRKTQPLQDRKILDMIRGLLEAETAFHDIYKKYKAGQLFFSHIEHWVDDRGQSPLYRLKEQCHSIFRDIRLGPLHRKEWLLDLAIGSIFHEAMKLRENIYQLEVYRPRYLDYKRQAGPMQYEKDYLQQFERIIARADQGVTEGMEETRFLFRDAKAQILDIFKANAENPYFVRFLLEQQPLLRIVYGGKEARDIFSGLFEKGLLGALRTAGQSYLGSEHYDLSSFYFQKALRMDPQNPEIQFLTGFSLGMKAYYNNEYSRALSAFSRLLSIKPEDKSRKEYIKKAEEICQKISVELKEEHRVQGAARARSLAEQFKRML
jgi:tetratricopeptide (TPR) repeat protein